MLNQTQLFGLLGGLLILAFLANRFFYKTRVPDLIVLMLSGLVLEHVLHWSQGNTFQAITQSLGNLALILILFEGGTELRLRETLRHFPSGILLATLGYSLSVGLVAGISYGFLQLPWRSSLLLGAVFGCTSSTMVLPVLQQMGVRVPVKTTLLIESALGDIIAVLMVGSLTNLVPGDPRVSGLISGFTTRVLFSILLALLAGFAWLRLWTFLAGRRFRNVATLGIVLVVYSVARLLGGSGLLAVLGFGLTLVNLPTSSAGVADSPHMLTFHSEFSFLVRSSFFLLLGMSVKLIQGVYIIPFVLILVALFSARVLTIRMIRRTLSGMNRREIKVVLWMFPRGLVTAVLALKVLEAKGEAFSFLPAMAFTVILITNAFMILGSLRSTKEDSDANGAAALSS